MIRFCLLILIGLGGTMASAAETPSGGELFRRMRDMVFGLSRESSFEKYAADGAPIAIVVEENLEGDVYSLVVVADGSTSLYFSNGGGFIGAGQHSTVRTASMQFLQQAKGYMDVFADAPTQPLPSIGKIRFYAISKGSVSGSKEFAEADLARTRLWPLFMAAHDVIAQIRLAAPPE